jgi:hypothetical protein
MEKTSLKHSKTLLNIQFFVEMKIEGWVFGVEMSGDEIYKNL